MLATAARADDFTKSDGRDGETGHPDISSVSQGHGDNGRFRNTIKTYGDFATVNAPCLQIRTAFPREQTYRVCGDGEIRRADNNDLVGAAGVDRPSDRTVAYVFLPSDIGGSDGYQWFAYVGDPECSDRKCDRAPNKGWIDHAKIVTYEDWANRTIRQFKAPTCKNNQIVMVAWEANEGTAARYNPLATTYKLPGSTEFNSVGVQNYESLLQGSKAVRLTIENGWSSYGYGAIVKKLRACAEPMATAKAIRASQWCQGCSGGEYVTWLIPSVKKNYNTYANRLISTL